MSCSVSQNISKEDPMDTYVDADLSSRTSKTELLAVAVILTLTPYRQPYSKMSRNISKEQ